MWYWWLVQLVWCICKITWPQVGGQLAHKKLLSYSLIKSRAGHSGATQVEATPAAPLPSSSSSSGSRPWIVLHGPVRAAAGRFRQEVIKLPLNLPPGEAMIRSAWLLDVVAADS